MGCPRGLSTNSPRSTNTPWVCSPLLSDASEMGTPPHPLAPARRLVCDGICTGELDGQGTRAGAVLTTSYFHIIGKLSPRGPPNNSADADYALVVLRLGSRSTVVQPYLAWPG